MAPLLFLLLFTTVLVHGAVHEYHEAKFKYVGPSSYVFSAGREGMFESAAAANTGQAAVDDKNSFISFSELQISKPVSDGVMDAIIFTLEDVPMIGATFKGQFSYCCVGDHEQLGCERGRVILLDGNNGKPLDLRTRKPAVIEIQSAQPGQGGLRAAVPLPWANRMVIMRQGQPAEVDIKTVTIPTTDMYHVWIITCDSEVGEKSIINGKTVWKNPAGYLPGRLQPYLPFYRFLALAYTGFTLLWLLLCGLFYKHLKPVQMMISAVIALGVASSVLFYYDYHLLNETGYRHIYRITWFAVAGRGAQRCVERILVLLVSMGYGITKPAVGSDVNGRVLTLAGVYTAVAIFFDWNKYINNTPGLAHGETDSSVLMMAGLVVFVVDVVCICWIFSALGRTIRQLKERSQFDKIRVYSRFVNILAMGVSFSLAWIIYEAIFIQREKEVSHWRTEWMNEAVYQVINGFALIAVALLFKPASNAIGYSFIEDDVVPNMVQTKKNNDNDVEMRRARLKKGVGRSRPV